MPSLQSNFVFRRLPETYNAVLDVLTFVFSCFVYTTETPAIDLMATAVCRENCVDIVGAAARDNKDVSICDQKRTLIRVSL